MAVRKMDIQKKLTVACKTVSYLIRYWTMWNQKKLIHSLKPNKERTHMASPSRDISTHRPETCGKRAGPFPTRSH